jgi:D-alanine-D-alanine ligase
VSTALIRAADRQRRRIKDAAPHVVVLYGPASSEDRAYFVRTPPEARSWHDLCDVLHDLGARRVDPVDVTTGPGWTDAARAADLVVVNLHGEPGEDGTVQGLLARLGVAFVGSSVEASVVALNKVLTKLVARAAAVRTPDAAVVADGLVTHRVGPLPPGEVVVKPIRGGSSLGVARLGPGQRWPDRGTWLVERYVHGTDVTVTVVEDDGRPVPLGAVVLEHAGDVYDADGKLGARARCTRPAELLPALAECETAAAAVHRLIGARHVSRSDFVVAGGRAWFLEINTLPGLSRISNAAESAHAAGLSYEDFLALVVGGAL